jgi:hypothetical protein
VAEFSRVAFDGPFRFALSGLGILRDRTLIAGPWLRVDDLGQMIPIPRPGPGVEADGDPVQFTCRLEAMVEPRMWFTQEAPVRLREAVDDLDQSLVPPAGVVRAHGAFDYPFRTGGGVTTAEIDFPLRLPDRRGRMIARLRGAVPVLLHARRPDPDLVIPLASAAGKTFRCDTAAITVDSVGGWPGSTQVKLTARLDLDRADLAPGSDPGLVTARLRMLHSHQLALVDAKGDVLGEVGGGGYDPSNVAHITLSTFGPQGGPPATELRYYGMVRARTEATFIFQNVPMP